MLFYIEIIRGNDYYQYLIRHPLCKSLVTTLRHSVCIYIYIYMFRISVLSVEFAA